MKRLHITFQLTKRSFKNEQPQTYKSFTSVINDTGYGFIQSPYPFLKQFSSQAGTSLPEDSVGCINTSCHGVHAHGCEM